MKTLPKVAAVSALILIGVLASGAAMADRGHGQRGGVRFGISVGVPIFGPRFYPAPYYGYPAYVYPAPVYAYPPVVVESYSPPVYIEQGTAGQAQTQGDWYYCAASQSYYPYVAECPAGWQRVPAQPPAR
jgi:hypothetical protein